MKLMVATTMAVLGWGTIAFAQSPPTADADFVMTASVGNTFEIAQSKLALEKATDARLKRFAEKMIHDHTLAETELKAAAGKAGDKAEMMLDPPHQAKVDALAATSGAAFDKLYTADQVAAHADTVALLSGYEQSGKTAPLKAWAIKSLPVVKEHKAMIDKM